MYEFLHTSITQRLTSVLLDNNYYTPTYQCHTTTYQCHTTTYQRSERSRPAYVSHLLPPVRPTSITQLPTSVLLVNLPVLHNNLPAKRALPARLCIPLAPTGTTHQYNPTTHQRPTSQLTSVTQQLTSEASAPGPLMFPTCSHRYDPPA